ncbi:MAG: hypothetical protein WBM46_09500, partial [Polyangiales bacterium]
RCLQSLSAESYRNHHFIDGQWRGSYIHGSRDPRTRTALDPRINSIRPVALKSPARSITSVMACS